jgi:mRNA interferase HicA
MTTVMTGRELLRRVQRLGRSRGIAVRFDQRHGKGSHGTLLYGNRKTTVKDLRKEIGMGLLREMLGQLGLSRRDLDEE